MGGRPMQLRGNTVLVTGGSSGIGRSFAVAMHRSGNRVVIAGRRPDTLRAVTDAHPGMEFLPLDVSNTDSIHEFVDHVERDFPDLNVVVNNAGIIAVEHVATPDPGTAAAVVSTNLLGPIVLTSLLLPTLRNHARGAIINVTSALAFVPMAVAPTYSATKAGLHSYTESLRFQLRDSAIQVIEIAPPRVEADMQGPADDHTMTVDEAL